MGIVLNSTEHYSILHKVKFKDERRKLLSWDTESEKQWDLFQCGAHNVARLRLFDLKTVSPAKVYLATGGQYELCMTPVNEPMDPLVASAMTAFEGITLPHLQLMYSHLKLPEPKPKVEKLMVESLLRCILEHLPLDVIAGILEMRGAKKPAVSVVPTVLNKELMDIAKDVLEESDGEHDDYAQAVDKHHAGGGGVEVRKPDKPILLPADVLDPPRAWASQFIPAIAGCTLAKDTSWHHRWIVHYPGTLQNVWTKAWTDDLSPLEALKELLQSVWTEHCIVTEESPWFHIDKLPEIVHVHGE